MDRATDNPEALGLEQKCVKPGRWLIEGYNVVRRGTSGHTWWLISRDGTALANRDTLTEAREWIREQS
jgi:hypothetical protein